MYTFKVNLTEQDYFNYNLFHVRNTIIGKKTYNSLRILFISLFILLTAVLFIVDDLYVYIILGPFVIAYGIYYIGFFNHAYMKLIKSNVKKHKKQGVKLYEESFQITYDDDSYTLKIDNSEVKSSYSKISDIFEGNHCFYLYENKLAANIIPYHSIGDENDVESFRKFIYLKKIDASIIESNKK